MSKDEKSFTSVGINWLITTYLTPLESLEK